MFIAMNRFRVAPGQGEVFESAWRTRQSRLSEVPGFEAFKLLKGDDGVYISHSTWCDEASFEAWTESDAFREAHRQRMPDGVLMGPPEVSCYHVVLSEGGLT